MGCCSYSDDPSPLKANWFSKKNSIFEKLSHTSAKLGAVLDRVVSVEIAFGSTQITEVLSFPPHQFDRCIALLAASETDDA